MDGCGVAQDYKYAMKWCRLAADQGNALAQDNLGVMYRDIEDVAQDYSEKQLSAAEWKDRAYKTMERAKRAEARVKELEQRLVGSDSSIDKSEMFQNAKRQFARIYHPDSIKSDGIEKVVRSEIFKEFWSILEKIEKAGNSGKMR